MNRASWLTLIQKWLHPAVIENVPGLRVPEGSPVFAGAVVTKSDGSTELRPITLVLRETAATFGQHVHGCVSGTYLVCDEVACIMVRNEGCSCIPWEEIVFIEF